MGLNFRLFSHPRSNAHRSDRLFLVKIFFLQLFTLASVVIYIIYTLQTPHHPTTLILAGLMFVGISGVTLYIGTRFSHHIQRTFSQLQALQKLSDERLQRLTENVPGVIYRYIRYADGSDRFTYISPRCHEIYEVDPEAVLVDSNTLWQLILPEDAALMQQRIQQSIASLQPWNLEYRICTPSGKIKWLQVYTSPDIREEDGVYWDGVVLEVSDRKQAEAILNRYRATLEEKVRERTTKLQEANQALERLAKLDGLTQLANRRTFDQHLSETWKRLAREQRPMALILCDIDYFKLYNDHYGHLLGDRALKAVAMVIQNSAKRPADLAARYGGEEFAIILPNTDQAGAIQVAEELRRGVMNLRITHDRSTAHHVITISLGVTAIVPSGDNALRGTEALIRDADKALYDAKKRGRNQICTIDREKVH
jgi:diguanylate cyclase (GGDEF)-like protein/PAS domain S-box-containing protein